MALLFSKLRLCAWMMAVCAVLTFSNAAFAQVIDTKTFPVLSGRVVDQANIVPAAEEARLSQQLAQLETQSGRQLVVATVTTLNGYSIEDYGYQLGRHWGIGEAKKNTGLILLIAPNDRKVRIEVGYGLTPYITDGMAGQIIRQEITPQFKAGDFPGGINAGVNAIAKQLLLPPEQAAKRASETQIRETRNSDRGFSMGAILFWLFILFFFIVPTIRSFARMGRKYDGPWTKASGKGAGRAGMAAGVAADIAQVIIWSAINSSNNDDNGGGGWGGGGGGWGGGGGFSGGGGSFGGGGASGSW